MSNVFPIPPAPPASTQASVGSEVDAELLAQTAPLDTLATGYGKAEDRAIQDLNALFSTIMPFVQGSAERVAAAYGASSQAQTSIFNQAYQRLNALRGERAAEAQALAQQLGAPIPLDQFTAAFDIERSVAAPEFGGELLKSQGLAQAGVQQAEAFAGRVFPLKQARLTQETHNFYRDKIFELKQQVAAIKGMRKGMINERLRTRLLEDYEMKLARSQASFDRFNAKKALDLEQKRIDAQLEEIRGSYDLGKKGLAQDKANNKKQANLNKQQYLVAKKQSIVELTNAMLLSGPQEVDRHVIVWETDPITGKKTARSVIETQQIQPPGVQNPDKLLNWLMAKTGINKKDKILYNYAIAQVIRSYKARGMTGIPTDPSKWTSWWKKRMAKKKPPGKFTGPGVYDPSTGKVGGVSESPGYGP